MSIPAPKGGWRRKAGDARRLTEQGIGWELPTGNRRNGEDARVNPLARGGKESISEAAQIQDWVNEVCPRGGGANERPWPAATERPRRKHLTVDVEAHGGQADKEGVEHGREVQ